MTTASSADITRLLVAWSNGEQASLEKLIPIVYGELRRLAKRYMKREGADHTLQTTALVHEAYVRLVDVRSVKWQNRAHFFAVSAQLMRRILVDFARSRNNLKRGGGIRRISIEDAKVKSQERGTDLVVLDDALNALANLNPRQCQVVELKFFGGLSVEETAEVLKVSPGTIRRDWSLARAWLNREISQTGK